MAAEREAEIAEVVRKKEARLAYERRMGCLLTLAIIAIGLLVSYVLGREGHAVDPNDPAFP